MRIQFKPGVRLHPHHFEPRILIMVLATAEAAPELIDDTLVVTSGCEGVRGDGVHGARSKHYDDDGNGGNSDPEAFDIRAWNTKADWRPELVPWADRTRVVLNEWCIANGFPLNTYQVVPEEKEVEIHGKKYWTGHIHDERDPSW